MSGDPLTALQVIAVRYRRTQLAPNDERSLDTYTASKVYQAAKVPVNVFEPRFPENERDPDEPTNLGRLGGIIAGKAAEARRENKAILMSGGDCTHVTGIVGGLQQAHGSDLRIGLVWFDAHGDINTPETSISGMLGGMPVAVCAGLALPQWREGSKIETPLPADRIILVDVRNLDPAEKTLIDELGVTVAAAAPGFPGVDLKTAVDELAGRCDVIYLHIDSDVLDQLYVPNHGTREPNGPHMPQVLAAIDTVMATGKVAAFAVVSVYGEGKGREISVTSGTELIRGGLESWRRHGLPHLA